MVEHKVDMVYPGSQPKPVGGSRNCPVRAAAPVVLPLLVLRVGQHGCHMGV